jgi:hypothetical protein
MRLKNRSCRQLATPVAESKVMGRSVPIIGALLPIG